MIDAVSLEDLQHGQQNMTPAHQSRGDAVSTENEAVSAGHKPRHDLVARIEAMHQSRLHCSV